MPSRRAILFFLLLGGMALPLSAHVPYRQWTVYRNDRLMIVSGKTLPRAFELTQALADDLSRIIPKARVEAARAPTMRHVTRLVLSKQIPVAVMLREEALQMLRGEGEGRAEGPVPLRTLAFLRDGYVLVAHADISRERAYLILFGLFDDKATPGLLAESAVTPAQMLQQVTEFRVPMHIGAREFLLKATLPPKKP